MTQSFRCNPLNTQRHVHNDNEKWKHKFFHSLWNRMEMHFKISWVLRTVDIYSHWQWSEQHRWNPTTMHAPTVRGKMRRAIESVGKKYRKVCVLASPLLTLIGWVHSSTVRVCCRPQRSDQSLRIFARRQALQARPAASREDTWSPLSKLLCRAVAERQN